MPEQRTAHAQPGAVLGPAVEPAPAGLVRRVLLGHVPPARPRPKDPQDAFDDGPEILRRATPAVGPTTRDDERRDQRPLCVREPHADGEASLWPLSTALRTSIQVRPWIHGRFPRLVLLRGDSPGPGVAALSGPSRISVPLVPPVAAAPDAAAEEDFMREEFMFLDRRILRFATEPTDEEMGLKDPDGQPRGPPEEE